MQVLRPDIERLTDSKGLLFLEKRRESELRRCFQIQR